MVTFILLSFILFDFSLIVIIIRTPENFVIEWKRNDQVISTQPVKPSHHTKDVVLSMNDQEMKMQAYLTRDNAEGKIFVAKNYKLSLLDVYFFNFIVLLD